MKYTIDKKTLNKFINASEGDWDFLIYKLDEYWKKEKKKYDDLKKHAENVLKGVAAISGDPYCCGDEYYDERKGRR